MAKLRFIITILLTSFCMGIYAEEEIIPEKFYGREYRYQGERLQYRVMFPKGYGVEGLRFPLLVYLHGEEERGDDNLMQLKYGATLYMSEVARNYQSAVVIMPQCPEDEFWAVYDRMADQSIVVRENPEQTVPSKIVEQIVQFYLKKQDKIDDTRVYLVGKDMGAFGVLDLAARNPKLYTAVAAVSGYIDPNRMKKKKVFCRIFNGVEDPIVPIQSVRELDPIIKSVGGESGVIEYQDTKHDDAWEMATSSTDLMDWLFEKVKK
ncbi:MAG: hypothetical protein MJZ14_10005 [Paludibacteraceae bacterium]|nr:hypothetical protein [Paludibacteraceae bacterium]